MMLMAAFSSPLVHATDLSGTVCAALRTEEIVYLGLPVSIPEIECQKGAIAQMRITQNGAFTLRIAFPNRVYRGTGLFVEHESSTPEAPYHTAEIGETTTGLYLWAERGGDGVISLFWRDAEGNGAGGGYPLDPVVRRNSDPNNAPAPYNTVYFRPDPILEGDDSSPEDIKIGTGYGSLRVSASGTSVFVGTLPDGESVVGSGPLTNGSEAMRVPVMLRASRGDSLVCNLPTLDSIEQFAQWYKRPSPQDKIHPAGGVLTGVVTTAPYTPPASGELAILGGSDQSPNMILGLSAADRPDIGDPYSDPLGFLLKPFTLTAAHRAVFPAPNAEKLKVDFHPRTGFFTGSVKLPSTPPLRPQTVQFSGMVKQHRLDGTGEAEGFYLADPLPGTVDAPKVSGKVRIVPYTAPVE